jgi:hypothetical protein
VQLLLIIGLPFGRFVWGGQNPVLPARDRVGSAVSIVVYVGFAVVTLERAALIPIVPPPFVVVVAMWLIALYLLLNVLPKLAIKSKHERRLWSRCRLLADADTQQQRTAGGFRW